MFCTSCGYKNEDGAAFCVACGADLDEKTVVLGREPEPAEELVVEEPVAVEEPANKPHVICRNCGAENEEGEPVCEVCGASLSFKEGDAPSLDKNFGANPGKVFGIIALVLGALGIVMRMSSCCYSFIPFAGDIVNIVVALFAIGGIVLAVMGKKKSKQAGYGNGFATAGLIVSIISLVLVVMGYVFALFGVVATFGLELFPMLAVLLTGGNSGQ